MQTGLGCDLRTYHHKLLVDRCVLVSQSATLIPSSLTWFLSGCENVSTRAKVRTSSARTDTFPSAFINSGTKFSYAWTWLTMMLNRIVGFECAILVIVMMNLSTFSCD